MDWLTKIIEVFKLPKKTILVIFLVSFCLLIFSDNALEIFKLKKFVETYGLFIGITMLTSGIFLFIELGSLIIAKFKRNSSKTKFMGNAIKRIKTLDDDEKSVLREFYLQGKNTLKLPMDNAIVAGLINSGVLSLVSRQGRMSMAGMLFNYKINDFIKEILTEELLDLPLGELTEADVKYLQSSRPKFMHNIYKDEQLFNT